MTVRQTKKQGPAVFGVPLTLQALLLAVSILLTGALVGLALLNWLSGAA